MNSQTITLTPTWSQTDYSKAFEFYGNKAEMEAEASKAAKGGYACLRAYARKRAIKMNTARHLARVS